jgi:hypothetical protein
MIGGDIRMPTRGMIADYRRFAIQTYERAAVRTVATIARRGKSAIRERMSAAGLGRLGNAIDARGEPQVKRDTGDRFTVSAQFFIRSRSDRTLGAIKAYTEGADIAPTRGRWLWVPTEEIQRLAGSNRQGQGQRMTPALWRERGYDRKIGPLFQIKSVNGYPVLALQGVGVDLSGRKRSVKSLTKKGLPRKGQVEKQLVVAFIGIPRTARAARVNITEILIAVQAQLPAAFATELAKEQR